MQRSRSADEPVVGCLPWCWQDLESAVNEPLAALIQSQISYSRRVAPAVLPVSLREELPSLKSLVVGGETVLRQIWSAQWSAGRRMVNAYGPTETTVCATHQRAVVRRR